MNNPLNIIMQLLMSGGNPQQAIQQITANNPQARMIINQMNSSGMNPKEFALQYAKQNNINPQPLINMIANRGGKI